MTCRDVERSRPAFEEVRAASPTGAVELLRLDVSSFASIREFAGTRPYASYKMYGDSKMAVLLLTYRMAEEYAARGIKVCSVMIPATKIRKEALKRFRGKYRLIGPLIQNLNPWALEPEEMGEVYFQICTSAKFAEVTGALVDSKLQVLAPVEGGRRLNPLEVARELRNTRHAPPYAGDPENVARMWEVGREVIGRALEGMAV